MLLNCEIIYVPMSREKRKMGTTEKEGEREQEILFWTS